jgi:hypothetical protein
MPNLFKTLIDSAPSTYFAISWVDQIPPDPRGLTGPHSFRINVSASASIAGQFCSTSSPERTSNTA